MAWEGGGAQSSSLDLITELILAGRGLVGDPPHVIWIQLVAELCK